MTKINCLFIGMGAVARSVACSLRKRAAPRSTFAPGTFFYGKQIPLPVVRYWRKNGPFLLVNCLREACPGTMQLLLTVLT